MKFQLKKLIMSGILLASVGTSTAVLAGNVTFADPQPSTPGVCDGGISYEWSVNMSGDDHVGLVGHVGAKSWNEPPPAYEPPYTGWTHTSNWIALELTEPTKLEIKVERQEGVAFQATNGMVTARNMLVPALSIYRNWDSTSCEDHRYNNAGNIDWSTVQYIGNQKNRHAKSSISYEARLPAGQYTIAIGGSPKVLETYPANDCDVADPVCYAYTGRHGYEVYLRTSPVIPKACE